MTSNDIKCRAINIIDSCDTRCRSRFKNEHYLMIIRYYSLTVIADLRQNNRVVRFSVSPLSVMGDAASSTSEANTCYTRKTVSVLLIPR